MIVQIEYFDFDVLTNLISILTMKPDKVIFIYDKDLFKKNAIVHLYNACKTHIKNLEYEMYPVDSDILDDVCILTEKVIAKNTSQDNTEYIIDLTGGGDLMTIGGYKVGKKLNLSMIYADIRKNQILDVDTNKIIKNTVNINLEDYLIAKGATLIGNSHFEPTKDNYNRLLDMSRYIFQNLDQWKKTCRYIQVSMSGNTSLTFSHAPQITFNGQSVKPDIELLKYCQEKQFISKLNINNNISFQFTSELSKQYMTTYGIWLELYVYIEACKIKDVTAIRLGAMIDWDADDGIKNVGNEIDVLLSKNSRPIFVSCKLTEPDTDAINEIIVNMRRVGGSKGKGILVTFSNIKSSNTGTCKRAYEMGIRVLDKEDILSDDFGERLRKSVDSLLRKDSVL
ncbi:MAG: hypothetical protein K0S41_396 [Anaerocolumna sp.]|jgi:hypothetical protein|nr:hypothetical protein [Anaerocolumna sp.]